MGGRVVGDGDHPGRCVIAPHPHAGRTPLRTCRIETGGSRDQIVAGRRPAATVSGRVPRQPVAPHRREVADAACGQVVDAEDKRAGDVESDPPDRQPDRPGDDCGSPRVTSGVGVGDRTHRAIGEAHTGRDDDGPQPGERVGVSVDGAGEVGQRTEADQRAVRDVTREPDDHVGGGWVVARPLRRSAAPRGSTGAVQPVHAHHPPRRWRGARAGDDLAVRHRQGDVACGGGRRHSTPRGGDTPQPLLGRNRTDRDRVIESAVGVDQDVGCPGDAHGFSLTAAPTGRHPDRAAHVDTLGAMGTASVSGRGTPPAKMFASDNAAGASAEIVDAVAAVSMEAHLAYGNDPVTAAAGERVAEVFGTDVDVHCVSTGSAANSLALSALTRPWGSILCHRSAHIEVDECGGPEFFTGGAKLVLLDGDDGKIDPGELRRAVRHRAGDVHSVQPQVLSLTQATETGSVYSLDEIHTLTGIARDAGLRTHLDGARFANALVHLDVSPAEMSWRCGVDLLSFGITKNGGMTTDAVVSFDGSLRDELAFRVKRAGQLASKLRFESAQVLAYLADDLWLRNARHANMMAQRLVSGLHATSGVAVRGAAQANLVFCDLPDRVIDGLENQGYVFHHGIPEPGVARLVTSHATTTESVDGLLTAIGDLVHDDRG